MKARARCDGLRHAEDEVQERNDGGNENDVHERVIAGFSAAGKPRPNN